MKKHLTLLAITGMVFLMSCSKQEQVQTPDTSHGATVTAKSGQGSAIIRAIDTTAKSITLDHNTIPGIMDAMTMEYSVSDPALLHSINVGDSVTFTLQDRGEGNYIVTNIALKSKQ